MSFKFTLLGLEINKCSSNKQSNSKKSSSHKNKFAMAVQTCHGKTDTKEQFGKCMRKELKK